MSLAEPRARIEPPVPEILHDERQVGERGPVIHAGTLRQVPARSRRWTSRHRRVLSVSPITHQATICRRWYLTLWAPRHPRSRDGSLADIRPRRRRDGAAARWMAVGTMLGALRSGRRAAARRPRLPPTHPWPRTGNDRRPQAPASPPGSTERSDASTATIPFPAGLVGTWQRTVTKEDVARASANSYLVGPCTLTVAAAVTRI